MANRTQRGSDIGPKVDMDQTEEFAKAVRQALRHLYDRDSLRQSTLVESLGLQNTGEPGEALRVVLEKAIEALAPPSDTPASSRAWRPYRVLTCCYMQELSQTAAADRLGITPRHLRRERAAALQALVHYLCAHYGLDELVSPSSVVAPAKDIVPPPEAEVSREMRWLGDSLGDRSTEVAELTQEALGLVAGLAQKKDVELQSRSFSGIPPVSVAGTVLKQILLNLLTTAISAVRGGRVLVEASVAPDDRVAICVSTMAAPGEAWQRSLWNEEAVAVARQLTELFGGQLEQSDVERGVVVRALLHRADQIVVLAIEDNQDTLHLWQRFCHDTRFRIIGLPTPEQAIDHAAHLRPRLILLDIMLPDVDGWELLGRFQRHPATADIPVIVCTVLPQDELARSLGADGFIRKTATGREFRAELERQIAAQAHGR